MTRDALPLDEPLPADLRRERNGLASYREYPAFSAPWLRKRTALFTLGFSSFGTLIGLASFLQGERARDAFLAGASFTAGALAIVTMGPLFATIVRHRRFTLRVERPLVVAVLLLGVGVSFGADLLASEVIEGVLGRVPTTQGETSAAAIVLNIVALVLIYGLFGGWLALRSYLDEPRRLRERARDRELVVLREKNEALDTHLGVLQAQIEPHFLFNTLASVRALITTDPQGAAEAIDGLVTYLRATIPRLRGAVVETTLDEQADICGAYLRLMGARSGRLEHALDIEREAGAMHFPPLLLLSLVENAVMHGIEPKSGQGRVAIVARCAHGQLVVRVEDDGVGLRPGAGNGVGLRNVREHLRARYGDRARFSLASVGNGGTVATITIDAEVPS